MRMIVWFCAYFTLEGDCKENDLDFHSSITVIIARQFPQQLKALALSKSSIVLKRNKVASARRKFIFISLLFGGGYTNGRG